MSSEETEPTPLSFQVVDSAGEQSTLELVETFRLQVKERVNDYCLVRPVPAAAAGEAGPPERHGGADAADDDELEELERGDGDATVEQAAARRRPGDGELQAYRLEDNGLASLEPGEETILIGQALLALQSVAWMDGVDGVQDEDEPDEEEGKQAEPRRARH